MSALKSAFFVVLLFYSLECLHSEVVTVTRGENATLECHGPRDATIIILRWDKTDIQSELYVFFFRDNRSHPDYQLPSFKGRVELKDPEMKNGNFSVILKNVTMNDTGRYECQAGYSGAPEPKLLSNITLKVEEPGQTEGHREDGGDENEMDKGGQNEDEQNNDSVGLKVGLPVAAVLLVAVGVCGFFIYRKRKRLYQPAVQQEPIEMSQTS